MTITTRTVSYDDQETALTGFLAWDETADRKLPGLLLVHGAGGLDDHSPGRRNGPWSFTSLPPGPCPGRRAG
jgi:hypothetical protein